MPISLCRTPVLYEVDETDGDRKVVAAPFELVSSDEGGSFVMPVEPASISALSTAAGSSTYYQTAASLYPPTPTTWVFGNSNGPVGVDQCLVGAWSTDGAPVLALHEFRWW